MVTHLGHAPGTPISVASAGSSTGTARATASDRWAARACPGGTATAGPRVVPHLARSGHMLLAQITQVVPCSGGDTALRCA